MRIFAITFLMAGVGLAANAFGSTLSAVTITKLMMDKGIGNNLYIAVNVPHQAGVPACQNSGWAFVLSMANPIDDKIYAGLLSAYATGKTVSLIGNGLCDVWPGIETLVRVEL